MNNKLEEFFEIFNIVVNTMNDHDILCNGTIGAALQDHKDFHSAYPNYKTFSNLKIKCL